MQKRCPICFNELGTRAKKCSACGQILAEIHNDGFLSVGTLVNERYYIGKIFKKEPVSTVYLAYDIKTDSKVLLREFTGESFLNGEFKQTALRERLVDRFINYSKSLATVSLCKLFPRTVELFLWRDNAYTVYAFFEGETLKNLLDNGIKISKGNIVKIAKTLCDELVILHNAHMIYGAISPDTIYISGDGSIHLFGIGSPFYEFITYIDDRAKILNPKFCAPEVFLNNAKRGAYSDVYSLAAVVYYVLLNKQLPLSFLRSKGETIEVPHRINDNIEKTLSTALLNALNWQVSARTKTLTAFYKELVGVKVSRRLSPMILLADALGVFWYCYDKAKAFALKTFAVIKNKFKGIKTKVKTKDKKNLKKLLWLWIAIPVVLLVILLMLILFGGDNPKGVFKPNQNSSQKGEDGWFYGSGENEIENSSKKSFLDMFGVESKKQSKSSSVTEASSSETESSSSDTESTANTSSQTTESVASKKEDEVSVDYSFSLKTMPVVSEMPFNSTGKKPIYIEYEALSDGIFKLLAYDDSSDGATLYVDIQDKNKKTLAKGIEISGENGADFEVEKGSIIVKVYTKQAPADMNEISLYWAFADNNNAACKLSLGVPSATRVKSGNANFTFSLDENSLISVTPLEACTYETDCDFYIKDASGEKVTDDIMIHGTEWISRKVFLPKGDYTVVVTGLRKVAACSIKAEKVYKDIILSSETVGELPVVFGYTSKNKGERKVKFNADGMDAIVVKPDGVNTYYDCEQAVEVKLLDGTGTAVITETCEGETNIDVSKLNGEYTLIVTADETCVVEVFAAD